MWHCGLSHSRKSDLTLWIFVFSGLVYQKVVLRVYFMGTLLLQHRICLAHDHASNQQRWQALVATGICWFLKDRISPHHHHYHEHYHYHHYHHIMMTKCNVRFQDGKAVFNLHLWVLWIIIIRDNLCFIYIIVLKTVLDALDAPIIANICPAAGKEIPRRALQHEVSWGVGVWDAYEGLSERSECLESTNSWPCKVLWPSVIILVLTRVLYLGC